MTLRAPGSTGAYPRSTWQGTVQLTARGGARMIYRQRFQVAAKSAPTAAARIIRAGCRAARARIRPGVIVTVSNLRRS